ncbi:MAG: trypsin-like peptidase domain-containing protein [bacterium]
MSRLVVSITILLWTACPTYIFAQELTPPSVADVVNQVSPAVVIIKGENISRTYQPGRIIVKHDYRIGSGFIINSEGYILTCNHIISNADIIEVELKSGKKYEAKILKRNSMADISLVKINAKNPLPAVKIGDATKVKAGNPIIIIGNPLPKQVNMPPKAFKHSVACGVIGSTERVSSNNMQLFQLSLPVNFGNSGGPLLNEYGEVIGIVNSKMLTFNSYPLEGVGFALSIKEAEGIFKELTIYNRKEAGIQFDELPLEKSRALILIFLTIIASVLIFILFIRIYQIGYKQYKFIKKKIYSAVYTGDYQRYANILKKVFKNYLVSINKSNELDGYFESLMDDLILLQTKEPWILPELSKRLEDLSTKLRDSLDLQRQIMKYQLKIKRMQKCYIHQF